MAGSTLTFEEATSIEEMKKRCVYLIIGNCFGNCSTCCCPIVEGNYTCGCQK